MPKYRSIEIDSDLYALAARGSASAKKEILQSFIDHVESDLPLPQDLQNSLVEILIKVIPTVKNDKGYKENGHEAWLNALTVQEAIADGKARTLEEAFAYVADAMSTASGRQISEETIKKHWKRFSPWVKLQTVPPFELLGDYSGKSQGNEK